ncbi:NUDIX hydrolase [Wenxinia marina]|uniref:Wenxma_13, whole genome shotgun sequence n=1 Tax=Wenxinia marina DSM 24838 TaxID=1123501 RepID=A0A0D0Q7C4_9RHOB|nr:NUDIX hydrolase [Wenxinia marina]KIQ68372.1 NTP pyrophosphohydrolase [Wenxinia marina DSM 24838]
MSLRHDFPADGRADIAPLKQLAALCWRKGEHGREVLLVTSSEGRWILPKGWPIDGCSGCETALTEAWEEAGVKRGKAARKPIGQFYSVKVRSNGETLPSLVKVYAIKVQKVVKDYPEADRRDRQWVSPRKAAALVTDEGLKAILRDF